MRCSLIDLALRYFGVAALSGGAPPEEGCGAWLELARPCCGVRVLECS